MEVTTINPLQINPETGFLESSDGDRSFNSVRKTQFLKLAHEMRQRTGKMPTVESLCDAVGISLTAFSHHKRVDEHFKAGWTEILYRCEDTLVETMYQNGLKSNGFMDRIAWLRRHFPENWANEQRITVTHNQQYVDTTVEKLDAYEGGVLPTHGTIAQTSVQPIAGPSQGNVVGPAPAIEPPAIKPPPPLPLS